MVCTDRDGPFVVEECKGMGGKFSCAQSGVARTKECIPGICSHANGPCIFDAVPNMILPPNVSTFRKVFLSDTLCDL